MIKNILITGIFISLLAITNKVLAQQDSSFILKNYRLYQQAIANRNGAEAAQFIDSSSLAYYGKMLDWVNTADSLTLSRLSLIDRLTVLNFRHMDTTKKIASFNEKKLFQFAIDTEIITSTEDSLGHVQVDKEEAVGYLKNNEDQDSVKITFRKENGRWKVDLVSQIIQSGEVIKALLSTSELAENDYLFYLLENMSGRAPDPAIWHKPL